MPRPLPPCLLLRPLPPAAPNELIARVTKEKTRESGTKWPLRNAVRPSVRFFVPSFLRYARPIKGSGDEIGDPGRKGCREN